MEFILTLIGIFFLYGIARAVFGAIVNTGAKATKAGWESITTGSSFSESFKSQNYQTHMGALEVLKTDISEDIGGRTLPLMTVSLRGFLNEKNITKTARIVLSFLDVTKEDSEGKKISQPVISSLEEMMEPTSRAFQLSISIGKIEPRVGYAKWAELFHVPKELLIPPNTGLRKMMGVIRVIEDNQTEYAKIHEGFHSEDSDFMAYTTFDVTINFPHKGYLDVAEDSYKIRIYFIKFAILIAYSDGAFDESEGVYIKKWMTGELSKIKSSSKKETFKKEMNLAFKESYELAKIDQLNLTKLIKEFKSVSDRLASTALMEFLVDLINIDNKIEEKELIMVNTIAQEIDVSIENIQNIKDKALLQNVNTEIMTELSIKEMLSISDDMDNKEIQTILNNEFRKWNGRIQSLQDEDEKLKAQEMLNKISDLMKDYE
jgi:uncharacterized tellurite resistance protein B-like protein